MKKKKGKEERRTAAAAGWVGSNLGASIAVGWGRQRERERERERSRLPSYIPRHITIFKCPRERDIKGKRSTIIYDIPVHSNH